MKVILISLMLCGVVYGNSSNIIYIIGDATNQCKYIGYGQTKPTTPAPEILEDRQFSKPFDKTCKWVTGEWMWWQNGADSKWVWMAGYWKNIAK